MFDSGDFDYFEYLEAVHFNDNETNEIEKIQRELFSLEKSPLMDEDTIQEIAALHREIAALNLDNQTLREFDEWKFNMV